MSSDSEREQRLRARDAARAERQEGEHEADQQDAEIASEEKAADFDAASHAGSSDKPPGGPVMMHTLVDAPRLKTAHLAEILVFEKAYKKYERDIDALCNQDVKATVKSLASCIETRVLRSICKYDLELPSDAWRTIEDWVLRGHLFGRRATLTQRERLEQARLLEQALVMSLKGGRSCEAAVIELFETLEEFLGEEDMDEVISAKKQCKLLIEALKPVELKDGVKALLDDTRWVDAKSNVVKLRRLVLTEATLQDACWERRPHTRPKEDKPAAKVQPKDIATTPEVPKKKKKGKWGGGGGGGGSHDQARDEAHKTKVCYTCGKMGHVAKACLSGTKVGGLVRKCYTCESTAHLARDCPRKPGVKRVSSRLSSEVRTLRRNAVIGCQVEVPLVMDSGADNTTISIGLYKQLKAAGVLRAEKPGGQQLRTVAGGHRVPLFKEVCVQLNLPTRAALNGVTMEDVWIDVITGRDKELLFGKREMRRLGLPLPEDYLDQLAGEQVENPSKGAVVLRVSALPYDEYDSEYSSDEESGTLPSLRAEGVRDAADRKGVDHLLVRAELEGASPAFMKRMRKCVQGEGVGVGCLSDELRPGEPAKVEPLDIEFIPGAKMPRMPAQRHYSPLQLAAMREQVAELQAGELIQPGTNGDLVSPVLMTKKKPIPVKDADGTERMESRGHRMCVDERAVNAVTVGAPFPMPLIDHILSQYLKGAKVFGTGDALKGYWQFPVTDRASKAWAFMTPDGVWEPKRVPMGVKNAVSHYQRVMTRIFKEAGLLHKGVLVFIDDILLYAKTEEELAELWERVFAALAKYNIYLCTKKTHLLRKEVIWCGKLISAAGRGVDPRRVDAILQVPEPTNGGQLMSFLACTNWIRDHIPGYAVVVARLQELLRSVTAGLKKKTKCEAEKIALVGRWEKCHAEAWTTLKQGIADSVTLTSPDEEMDFCLYTDASDNHWGAILTQVPPGWVESQAPPEDWPHQPVAFLSGSFKNAQMSWPIVGKEAFAVHEACDKLEHFIQRNRGVHIFTDHRNLVYIFDPAGRPAGTSKGTAGRLERWGIALSAVPYIIQHVEGESNDFADMLSRWGATRLQSAVQRVELPLPDAQEQRVAEPDQDKAVRVVRVQLRPGAPAAEFVESDDEADESQLIVVESDRWPSTAALALLQGEVVSGDGDSQIVDGTVLHKGDTEL